VQRGRGSGWHDSGRKVDNAVRHLSHAVSLRNVRIPDKRYAELVPGALLHH
jgi:hypothetical protein